MWAGVSVCLSLCSVLNGRLSPCQVHAGLKVATGWVCHQISGVGATGGSRKRWHFSHSLRQQKGMPEKESSRRKIQRQRSSKVSRANRLSGGPPRQAPQRLLQAPAPVARPGMDRTGRDGPQGPAGSCHSSCSEGREARDGGPGPGPGRAGGRAAAWPGAELSGSVLLPGFIQSLF